MYYKLTFYFRLFNLSSYFLDIIRSSTAHDLLFIVCWTVKNDGVTCMCVYSLLLPYVYSGHAIFTLTPPICVSSDRARETPQNPQLTSKSWVSSVSVRLFSCFKMICLALESLCHCLLNKCIHMFHCVTFPTSGWGCTVLCLTCQMMLWWRLSLISPMFAHR